jgi:hypothetical protein
MIFNLKSIYVSNKITMQQASAPEMDLDTCIEHGRYFACKMNDHDILIKKALENENITLYQKLVKERDFFHKELIIYAKLANYLKNLQKFEELRKYKN